MEKTELIEHLNYFLDPQNPIGAAIYFVVKEGDNTTIRFADIENTAKEELKTKFLSYLKDKFLTNEDLQLLNISEADARANTAYRYDIVERPQGLNILNEILQNEEREHFKFSEHNLKDVEGYLITIGNEGKK